MSYRELFNRIQRALPSPEAYSSFQKKNKIEENNEQY